MLQISVRLLANLTVSFCGFLQLLHANDHHVGHNNLLPDPYAPLLNIHVNVASHAMLHNS